MIAHIVLFEPPASLPAEDRRRTLDAVLAGLRRCRTVRGARIGRRIRHGLPGYEQAMSRDFEYALVLEFDDEEGLRAYLGDPAHARLGQVFSGAAAALAYDYEITYEWPAAESP